MSHPLRLAIGSHRAGSVTGRRAAAVPVEETERAIEQMLMRA